LVTKRALLPCLLHKGWRLEPWHAWAAWRQACHRCFLAEAAGGPVLQPLPGNLNLVFSNSVVAPSSSLHAVLSCKLCRGSAEAVQVLRLQLYLAPLIVLLVGSMHSRSLLNSSTCATAAARRGPNAQVLSRSSRPFTLHCQCASITRFAKSQAVEPQRCGTCLAPGRQHELS
jgi:hypothetical protein